MKFWFDTEFIEDGKTIELISIGIVREDGAEYYAEVRDEEIPWERANPWVIENVKPHLLGGKHVKSKDEIAHDLKYDFIRAPKPEFWAYCGAYDWVVLNQLYGPMVDHPSRWPFYCNDISQLAESTGVGHGNLPRQTSTQHHALEDARWAAQAYWYCREMATP